MLSTEQKIEALKRMKTFVKSKEFGKGKYYDGLCFVAQDFRDSLSLGTYEQAEYLVELVEKEFKFNGLKFHWKPGLESPRIKWIDKQIKKLEKK